MGNWYIIKADTKTGERLQSFLDRKKNFSKCWCNRLKEEQIYNIACSLNNSCDVFNLTIKDEPVNLIWKLLKSDLFCKYVKLKLSNKAYKRWRRNHNLWLKHIKYTSSRHSTSGTIVAFYPLNKENFVMSYNENNSYPLADACGRLAETEGYTMSNKQVNGVTTQELYIKWEKGTPKLRGEYLVVTRYGTVEIDEFRFLDDMKNGKIIRYPIWKHNWDVIYWCKIKLEKRNPND